MAYSIQREVSDGTLQTLTLRISYFKKTHIFVYVDDKLADGSTGRYSWVWDGDRIRLNKVVPVGIEVIIRRKTPMDAPFHNFRQGAVFKDVTMDENFIQQLYINQENVEGLTATDFYSDLDLHNYRMKNVGTAISDADAVSLGQYRADALGANQYRILAEASKVAAKASEVASAASATAALVSENKAKASETAAKLSEVNSKAVEVTVVPLVPIVDKATKDAVAASAQAVTASAAAKQDALDANQYRTLAEGSKVAAKASEVASAASAQIATTASRDAGSASVSAANSAASIGQAEQRVLVLRDQAKTFSDYSATYAANSKASADLANGSEADARNSVTLAVKEADRAKAEADRAGSIVGFEEVPFPDVWIPFSDDLSMLAGTNHAKMPAKFGADTILIPSNKCVSFERASTATYTDKSGVLRTAAIDEPRFEKEGLLIEGQSTNLVTSSSVKDWVSNGVCTDITEVGDLLRYTTTVNASGRVIIVTGLTVGTTYTLSFYAMSSTGKGKCGVEDLAKPVIISDKLTRHTSTFVSGGTQVAIVMYGVGDGAILTVGRVQLEALPFTTSYIPTHGAAATRAADVCMVNNVINTGKDTDSANTTTGFTAAVVSDLKLTTGQNYPSVFGIAPDSNPLNSQRRVTIESGGFVGLWCGANSITPANGLSTVVISKRVGESIGAVNGSIYKTPFLYGYSGSVIVFQTGHIRNFRIWHSALTDTQIKGLK